MTHRPFAPGDEVHVAGLGKGIIREARRGGRFLVEIKGRALLAEGFQLTAVGRARKRTKPLQSSARGAGPEAPAAHAPVSIDLHGLTPPEAIAALDAFVNDALLAGHVSVQVIHGRGAGRLKAAVHARLASIAAVRHVRVDPANPGVTIATFG
jgi:dsDNA-specific endonuclease/ATPase MutS2